MPFNLVVIRSGYGSHLWNSLLSRIRFSMSKPDISRSPSLERCVLREVREAKPG